jgi:monofunctional biosynthetic peptidoglycan transglycosylase
LSRFGPARFTRTNVALGALSRYAGSSGGRKADGVDETAVKPDSDRLEGVTRPVETQRRSRLRRWMRRLFWTLGVLCALPVVLTLLYVPPVVHPVSTLMLADLALARGYDRQWVSIDDVAPVLANSVIMSEDGQFCSHGGIDWGEMRGVVNDALAGEQTRGASTITMQTAKNLYLWSSRSLVRKGLELPLAVYIDAVLSKRRIMEIYLNIAEWGPGVYGIEAGAQHHFGVPASRLTPRQAALLAVTLPNPITRDPARPSAGMKRLANIVQRRAARSGDYVQCLD